MLTLKSSTETHCITVLLGVFQTTLILSGLWIFGHLATIFSKVYIKEESENAKIISFQDFVARMAAQF